MRPTLRLAPLHPLTAADTLVNDIIETVNEYVCAADARAILPAPGSGAVDTAIGAVPAADVPDASGCAEPMDVTDGETPANMALLGIAENSIPAGHCPPPPNPASPADVDLPGIVYLRGIACIACTADAAIGGASNDVHAASVAASTGAAQPSGPTTDASSVLAGTDAASTGAALDASDVHAASVALLPELPSHPARPPMHQMFLLAPLLLQPELPSHPARPPMHQMFLVPLLLLQPELTSRPARPPMHQMLLVPLLLLQLQPELPSHPAA